MKKVYYTGKGDDGTSSLFGKNKRFPKDDSLFDLLGTLDELNAWLGLCRASCNNFNIKDSQLIKGSLEQTQEYIFIIQAEIAGSEKSLSEIHLHNIEKTIDTISERLTPPNSFYLPGGCIVSSFLDIARTVARRCERIFFKTQQIHTLQNSFIPAYLNRISSLLYVLVRFVNMEKDIIEKSPQYTS